LLGLARHKSLGRLSNQPKQEECTDASHRNQSQKQKASFINNVRRGQLSKSIPALLGDGILAAEGGVFAIEDALHNLKTRAIERMQKANTFTDVPLAVAAKVGDITNDMVNEKALVKPMTASDSTLRASNNSSEIAHRQHRERANSSENSDAKYKRPLNERHTLGKSVVSNVVNIDRKSGARRSSHDSLSSSTQSKNKHKGKLDEFYPRRSSLNAFNTNIHGELISWDDLEDAIYVGLHNSLADIDTIVNEKQDWGHHTRNESSAMAANKRNDDSHQSDCQTQQMSGVTRSNTVDDSEQEGPWCCNKCTFLNENPLHLICGACNLPRYLKLRS
jgi:hypothetical protein